MQQIADWLEKLGLGQYAQRFAENDIDFDLLSDLTDHDLEKIGVTSVGHRRKLLRGRTNEVREHHRDLPAFGSVRRSRCGAYDPKRTSVGLRTAFWAHIRQLSQCWFDQLPCRMNEQGE